MTSSVNDDDGQRLNVGALGIGPLQTPNFFAYPIFEFWTLELSFQKFVNTPATAALRVTSGQVTRPDGAIYSVESTGEKHPLEEPTGPEPAVDSAAIANGEDTTKKPKLDDETIQNGGKGKAPTDGTFRPVESEPESAFEVNRSAAEEMEDQTVTEEEEPETERIAEPVTPIDMKEGIQKQINTSGVSADDFEKVSSRTRSKSNRTLDA
ncbi:hypothetical protein V1523DRAFT_431835 [Lipomyces doorenjongii]